MNSSLRQYRNDFFLRKSNPQFVVYENNFLTPEFIRRGKKNYSKDNTDPFIVDWDIPKDEPNINN